MQKNNKMSAGDAVFAVLRVLAAVICGLFLYTFLFTMGLNQINLGDVAGSIYCIAVILLVIAYPFLRRNKRLRTASRVCGIALAAFAAYCAVISGLILSEMIHGEDRAVAVSTAGGSTPQTVIVLGCKTINGEPSQMLTLRLNKALEYMQAHPDTVCVVTGGQGDDEIEPEAVTMQRYLAVNGIPASRIFTEPDSTNTTDNIRYAASIIKTQGLPQDVVVVSECYHIFRGVRQAKLAGLSASGIYPDPSSVIITMPTYWLREIFAISRDIALRA